jgi:hypothetical protein
VKRREVPPQGLVVEKRDLSASDAAAFADTIGVDSVDGFVLAVRILPYRADGLRVEGRVKAKVTQACVVTLEPVVSTIDEEIGIGFRPEGSLPAAAIVTDDEGPAIDASVEGDDPMVDDRIDLAAIAAEFLTLGVDLYPRKPGATFDTPEPPGEEHPFAALSRLKR